MELNSEHQRVRDEARERIKRLMARLVTDENHIVGESFDDYPIEGKNG